MYDYMSPAYIGASWGAWIGVMFAGPNGGTYSIHQYLHEKGNNGLRFDGSVTYVRVPSTVDLSVRACLTADHTTAYTTGASPWDWGGCHLFPGGQCQGH